MLSQQTLRSFTKQAISDIDDEQIGVYGILTYRLDQYKQRQWHWLYIGKGDIKNRMARHLNGDIPDLLQYQPTHWVGICHRDHHNFEKEMILKYQPICNKKVG
jgi:hypothetical protein